MSTEELLERYAAALHAVQSGIKWTMDLDALDRAAGRKPAYEEDATSPKHLRVGIDSLKAEQGGLVRLLVDRGVFTMEEYVAAMVEAMETEQKLHEDILSKRLGRKVHLG